MPSTRTLATSTSTAKLIKQSSLALDVDSNDAIRNAQKENDDQSESKALMADESPDDDMKPSLMHTGRSESLPFYDSLRGISAICVVFHHVWFGFVKPNIPGTSQAPQNGFLRWLISGSWHVFLFFALSGRVLAHRYLLTRDSKQLLFSMVKRPFRLLLPLICAYCIAYLVFASGLYDSLGFNTPWVDDVVRRNNEMLDFNATSLSSSSIFSYIPEFNRAFSLANTYYPSGVLWTVAIEAWYSNYVYILAFITVTAKPRFALLFLTAVSLHTLFYLKNYMYFVLGFIVSVMSVNGFFTWRDLKTCNHHSHHHRSVEEGCTSPPLSPGRPRIILKNSVLQDCIRFLLIALTILVTFTDVLHPIIQAFASTLLSSQPDAPLSGWARQDYLLDEFISIALLFLSIETTPLLQDALCFSWLQYWGQLSFGMYVMHAALSPLLGITLAVLIRNGWPTDNLWVVLLSTIPYFVMVWMISDLFVDVVDLGITAWLYSKLSAQK